MDKSEEIDRLRDENKIKGNKINNYQIKVGSYIQIMKNLPVIKTKLKTNQLKMIERYMNSIHLRYFVSWIVVRFSIQTQNETQVCIYSEYIPIIFPLAMKYDKGALSLLFNIYEELIMKKSVENWGRKENM